MYQLGIIIFCLAVVHPFFCHGEVKVDVSDDPILDYLNMNPAHVIEHELVHINLTKHKQKRAPGSNQRSQQATGMRVRAFGEDINLWLHPRDSLLASKETPVYFAYANLFAKGGVTYKLQADAMKNVGKLYEDPNYHASVVIGSGSRNDGPAVTTHMRSKRDNSVLVIRPLSEEVVEQHLRKRRSMNGYNPGNSLNSARHVVLRVKDSSPKYNIGKGNGKVNVRENSRPQAGASRAGNGVYPSSLYPKIFVQIDATYWNAASLTSYDKIPRTTRLLEYVLAFWNGVDLGYRHLENPNIRFHISGIAIAISPEAAPYLSAAQTVESGHNAIDADIALERAAKFYYAVKKEIPFEMYNIAVIMTLLPLTEGTLGMAFPDVACDSPSGKEQRALALISDDGTFSGIVPAIHELGHSFGLYHDDQFKTRQSCSDFFGFIMESRRYPTENSTTFSPCSLRRFDKILKQGKLKCLYNPPLKKSPNLPIQLPGRIRTLDEQCQSNHYVRACSGHSIDPCVEIYCMVKREKVAGKITEICKPLEHGAAPGTPCGTDVRAPTKFCLQSRCVDFKPQQHKIKLPIAKNFRPTRKSYRNSN